MGKGGKYSIKDAEKTAKARGTNLRVHFKKCHAVGQAIKGKNLVKAIKYLEDVLEKKAAIPFKRYMGGCGRHAMGKQYNAPGDQVGWPVKACKYFLDLLRNLRANGEANDLDVDQLYLTHVQVNHAPKMRRRTYRAHGRIGPYMCNPSHIELVVTERQTGVPKAAEDSAVKTKMTRKQLARKRLRNGAGSKAVTKA